jgi:TPR repeat protein
MYENGLAVEINPKIAFNLYTKSLESSKEPSPKVYFKLGNCYENGFGI